MYTNNVISKLEIGKIISFAIATRKIRYLGINLTKEVKVLYLVNYRKLRNEIKEDTNKWKHIPILWTGRISCSWIWTSLKCPYYPKPFIDSMQFRLKYQRHISQLRTNISKICMEA